jgi:hypothetical protein
MTVDNRMNTLIHCKFYIDILICFRSIKLSHKRGNSESDGGSGNEARGTGKGSFHAGNGGVPGFFFGTESGGKRLDHFTT